MLSSRLTVGEAGEEATKDERGREWGGVRSEY
jgi:hypothetical protein